MSEQLVERADDHRGSLSGLPRRLGSAWALLLVGPVVGMTYFWLVYLLGEASCADELTLLGTGALRTVIFAAAAATVTVFALYAWRARRLWISAGVGDDAAGADDRRQNRQFMVVTGLMLLGMFTLLVLFLAAPLLGASLC
ncbi:MAG: hypothetical protein ACR2HQ_08320 [Ilumatobacteraceae bacterium]